MNVHLTELIKPDHREKFTLESKEGGRVNAENVSGGEFAIFNSCDNVFDKPIIIAEGIDLGQNVEIEDLHEKYFANLQRFVNNGYDLVFLNYNNGRDKIQDNAQVLKHVINVVKGRISTTDSIVVIGESMSGLVARWALREMENAGQSHKVKLFIAFDTPNQGANIPPGLIEFGHSIPQFSGWANPILQLFPFIRAINTNAAKQMLLFHQGTAPHPDRHSFVTALNNLGNGGYPAQSRNVAMVSGSLSGVAQVHYDGGVMNPGDRILHYSLRALFQFARIEAWTNKLADNTKLYEGASIGILNGWAPGNLFGYLPTNQDRLPGGYISFGTDHNTWVIKMDKRLRFTFMPVYSSIDYKGPLNNDNNYTFPVIGNIINNQNQVISPSLTPFKAIYGENDNNFHAEPDELQTPWNTLAFRELGLVQNPGTIVCTLAPPPAVTEWYQSGRAAAAFRPLRTRDCQVIYPGRMHTAPIMLYVGDGNRNYEQFVDIFGPNGYYLRISFPWNQSKPKAWNFALAPRGTYNLVVTRRNLDGSGAVSTSSTFTAVYSCSGARLEARNCPIDEENGEAIGILDDTNEPCYSVKVNGIWTAVLGDGTFVSRERLIANGLSQQGAECYSATDPTGSNPSSTCPDLGSISYQRWEGIGEGSTIDDLLTNTNYFQNSPTVSQNLNIFEAPSDFADNYGSQIRGYVCPPTSGQYTFWIAGDDHVELWLSSDDNRDNAELIAYHANWTNSREWSLYSTQRSFPIQLQAGQRYYIEARMKESAGGDNLSVGWQLPNGALERPIPGNRLSPYIAPSNPSSCDFNVTASGPSASPTNGQNMSLNSSCSGPDCGSVTYSWSGNGISSSSPSVSFNVPSAGNYTYYLAASKSGCATQNINVNVTVVPVNNNGPGLANGCYTIKAKHSNKFMQPDNNNDGASIKQFGANGQTNQIFELTFVDGDSYKIQSKSSNKVWDATGSSYGSTINQYDWYNTNNQKWILNLQSDAAYTVSPKNTAGLLADIESVSIYDGGYLHLWGNLNADNQRFYFSPVGCGGGSSGCDLNISATSSNPTPSINNPIQLNAPCNGGDCGAVTYSWSGNGISGNSQSININVPGSSGTYYYTVTAYKSGCSDKTSTVSITVGGGSNGVNCSSVVGHMYAGCYAINGWVYDQSQPNTVINVDIFEGTTLIQGNVPANMFGQDLLDANIGNGVHRFQIETPSFLLNGQNRSIRVLASGCAIELYNSPKTINCSPGARIGSAEIKQEVILKQEEGSDLIVSPNPNTGNFEAAFYLEQGKKATLSVVDVKGTSWYERSVSGKGNHKEKVVLTGHPAGTFIVILRRANQTESKKVIVIK